MISIDKFYFLKTFGSSFLYFLIFFFYYLLLVKNVFYFYYIIVNFITFPFAKALFDWMGVYKIRQRIDNEPFPDYHYVLDRKSTRLNSSHVAISYAVFCLKKKNKELAIISIVTNYTL